MYHWVILAVLLMACGAPPVKKQATKRKLATLAPSQTALPMKATQKSYIILGRKMLPDEDTIENTFARLSLVAEVGPSPDGLQMGLPGVVCTTNGVERPNDVPSHILPESHEPHGLTAKEARSVSEATHYQKVVCVPDDSIGSRDLHPKAEQAATAIAKMMDGWIADLDTARYWPRDAWGRSRKKTPRYSAQRAYRVLTSSTETGPSLLYTRGLAAFGRPEIGLFPVSKADVERVRNLLPDLADLLLEDKKTGPGYGVSYGSIDSLLVNAEALLATYPQEKRPKAPAGLTLLLLVPGSVDVGDAQAFQQYLNRLLAN